MKKFLLVAAGALIALFMITSCSSGPSGNPQKDAEDFKDLYKDIENIKLKIEEKKLEVHEFYADQKDSTEYNKFVREVTEVELDMPGDFKKENKEKYDKIEEAQKVAAEKLAGNSQDKSKAEQ